MKTKFNPPRNRMVASFTLLILISNLAWAAPSLVITPIGYNQIQHAEMFPGAVVWVTISLLFSLMLNKLLKRRENRPD